MQEIKENLKKKEKVQEEIADIMHYLITLSYVLDIDLMNVSSKKLKKNRVRYPNEKVKGKHTNPIQEYKAHH